MKTADKAARLSISEIRRVIDGARWLRNDLVGGTSEEFARQDVGGQLTAKIATLRALEIPARFSDDIARRAEEIEFCQRVIARWEPKRAAWESAQAEKAQPVAVRPTNILPFVLA